MRSRVKMGCAVAERRLTGIVLAAVLVLAADLQAAAPARRYIVGADAVVDAKTGLTWQRVVPPQSYSWANAKGYCQGLTLAGQSEWRLPTRKELRSLVDIRARNPAIDSAAFPNTPRQAFWSSSASAHNASDAWLVTFEVGHASFEDIGYGGRVRCVR